MIDWEKGKILTHEEGVSIVSAVSLDDYKDVRAYAQYLERKLECLLNTNAVVDIEVLIKHKDGSKSSFRLE